MVNQTFRGEAEQARRQAAQARRDPLDDEIRELNERRVNIRMQRAHLKNQIDAFVTDDGPSGGGDLFERDPLTRKPMKNPDGSFIPRMEAEVQSLRSTAEAKTGTWAGAFSMSKRAGDPTDDARAAQKRLAELEPLYRLKREKFERLQQPLRDLDTLEKTHVERLAELAKTREARYVVTPDDVAGAIDSVNAGRAMVGRQPVRVEDVASSPASSQQSAAPLRYPSEVMSPISPRALGSHPRAVQHALTPEVRALLAQVYPNGGYAGVSIPSEAVDAKVKSEADRLGLPETAARIVEVDELRRMGVSHIGGEPLESLAGPAEAVGEARLVATVNRLKDELDKIDAATGPDSQVAESARERLLRQREIVSKLLERKTSTPEYERIGTFLPELRRGAANVMAGNAAIVRAAAKPFSFVENAVARALDLKNYEGGFDRLAKFATEANRYWRDAAAGQVSRAPQRIEDIRTGGDFGRWFVGQVGQQAPVIADLIATTIATGGANVGVKLANGARRMLPTTIVPLFERALAKGQIAPNVLKRVGGSPQVLLAATKAEFGSIYSDMLEMGREEGDPHKYDNPAAAAVFGVVAGTLEQLPVAAIMRKMGLLRDAYQGVIRKAVADPALMKRVLAGASQQAALEGGTEFFQTWIENAALSWVNENRPLFSPDNFADAMNAAASGAAVGAAIGGPAGISRRSSSTQPVDDGPQTPEAPQPGPTTPASTPDDATTFEFTDGSGRRAVVSAPDMRTALQQLPEDFGEIVDIAEGGPTSPLQTEPPSRPSPDESPPSEPLTPAKPVYPTPPPPSVMLTHPPTSAELPQSAVDTPVQSPPNETGEAQVKGEKIDPEWTAFAPASGSLGVPRAEMPQVNAEHRGALTQFLKARGVEHTEEEVLPGTLKPSQAEYSPTKVQKAREFTGGDRAILVSSDGYVIDGHHQWLKDLDQPEKPIRVIRFNAPVRDLLATVKEFPSADASAGATPPGGPEGVAADPEPVPFETLFADPKRKLSVRDIVSHVASGGDVESYARELGFKDIDRNLTLQERKFLVDELDRRQRATDNRAAVEGQLAAKEPWQMTRAEWEKARESVRPETFGSSPAKASVSAEASRMERLRALTFGVTDDASQKLREAAAGRLQLSPEVTAALQERVDTPVSHRDVIEKALREGKDVPSDIRAEYADVLTKSATPEATASDSGADRTNPAKSSNAQSTVSSTPVQTVELEKLRGQQVSLRARADDGEIVDVSMDAADAWESVTQHLEVVQSIADALAQKTTPARALRKVPRPLAKALNRAATALRDGGLSASEAFAAVVHEEIKGAHADLNSIIEQTSADPAASVADHERAKTLLAETPDVADAARVRERHLALESFTKKYAGERGTITSALRAAAEKAATFYTAETQKAAAAAAKPLKEEASMREKHRELIRQVDAAMTVAPVINPNEIADKDERKRAQSALNASGITLDDLAVRRQVSPDAVGMVTIKAGTATIKVRADYVSLEKMRRRLEKPVPRPTAPTPEGTPRPQEKVIEDFQAAKSEGERRSAMDQMTDATLKQLGLDQEFVRVGPLNVMRREAAGALERLKRGATSAEIDVEAATPDRPLDDGTPASQLWRDARPDELPETLRQQLGEFETALNQAREEGEPATRLAPKALSDNGTHLPAGTAERFRRQLEQVFGKRILFVEPSEDVAWGAASSPQRANTIVVNTRTETPLMALTGHELAHNLMAQRPELHRDLAAAVLELAPVPTDYAAKKRRQGYDTDAKVSDEWISDVVGERWVEPEFWSEVRRVTEDRPGVFRDLAETALSWLKRIVTRAGKLLSREAQAEFIPHVEKVRTVVAKALRDYAAGAPYPDLATGATADHALSTPEGAAAGEPNPQKPAAVPGKEGWFYRSEPDSLRAVGRKVARQMYERRSQADAAETAKAVVDEIGEEQAARLALDPNDNGVPGDVKTTLYGELIARKAKRLADPATPPSERAQLQREIQQLDNVKAPALTERGQEISALRQAYKDVRTGTVATYLEDVRAKQDAALGGEAGKRELQDAARALNKVNAEAEEKAAADMTQRLDRVGVNVPLWQKYRQWAADRLLEWVEDRTTLPQDKAPLVDFTGRVLDEIRTRMGATLPKAEGDTRPKSTAADLLKEAVENREKYADVVKTVRATFAEQYGADSPILTEIDMALGNLGLKPYSRRLLDKAIEEAHAAMKTNVAEIARMHYTNADRLHRSMADALVTVAGVPKKDAKALAADLEARMQELTVDAKKAALDRLRSRYDSPRARKILNAVERAVLLNNYGAMNRTELADVVAKELRLPRIDPEQMTRLSKLADDVETAPNEAEKARAELSLANEMRIVRGISKADIATSIWYANLLSGYATQLANVGGNVMNGTLNLGAVMLTNPRHAGKALRGWIDGFGEGWQQGKAIIATGRGSREFDAKTGSASPVLELVDYSRQFPNLNDTIAQGLNLHAKALRYVFRTMKAVDAVFYYPAREAYARVAVAKLLEGKYEGKELYAKVRDTLAISPSAFAQAKAKAEREGFSGLDLALRTANIIEDMRRGSSTGREAAERSEKFALETTFNNEPIGWAGVFYRHAADLTDNMKPGGVPVLKAFLPFLRIPTNLFNASMNYTPLGTLRAYRGMEGLTRGERVEFNEDERSRLLVQSIGGSLAMGGLAILALSTPEGEEPEFTITATGPADYRARQQLQATGWNPHSIKIGDVWVSYKDSPLLTPLALAGHVVDAIRYKKAKDDMALGNMVADAALKAPRVIFETSMLSGLGQLFDLLESRASAQQVRQFLTRTAAATMVPNLLAQIDRTFDPEVRLPDGPLGEIGAAMPFVRNEGTPRSDVLGQPVERAPLDRFVSVESNDPVREVLRDKGVFISVPRKTTIAGREMTDTEHQVLVRVSGHAIRQRLSGAVPQLRRMDQDAVERFVDRIAEQEHHRAKLLIAARVRGGHVDT